jgi:DNA topoisomerase-1
MNKLIIVESPAKAKTINKILGNEYTVKASIGHIKDLPEKELGVDIENDFKPFYVVIPGKEKIIRELKKASREADVVYLAPDPDREGEAIAWHIATEIGDKKESYNGRIFRIIFNEITEKAVKEAIENPKKIDMNKVDAQQARRILDRLVGYKLSPLLWKKIKRGLSAGRVQSVAVRLVVDREREIENFKPQEYWSISAEFEGSEKPTFLARLYKIDEQVETHNKFLITDEKSANDIIDDLKGRKFILRKIERKQRKRMPSPPFITSTLQQEAAKKLKFPAKKTMLIAQQLYEGIELGDEGSVGLITYMRTDSPRVAEEAQKWARDLIKNAFGKEYIPEKPPVYKSKSTAQEAHEAIRPTYPNKPPESVKGFLSRDQFAVYKLIWDRFIASQMSPAQYELTTFFIECPKEKSSRAHYEFKATGTIIKFDGFLALYTEGKEEIEEEGLTLPTLREGEALRLLGLQKKQHFTQPPPRYTEATLVKALEEKGIGRPSTYATILSTIQERRYVQKHEGKFFPTELGVLVNDFLVDKFPELIDVRFTAKMEDSLDRIEEGKLKWIKVIKDFYKPFSSDLLKAEETSDRLKPKDIPTEVVCEKCGSPMIIRWGRHGRFLACSAFPQCRNTKPIANDGNNGQFGDVGVETTDEKCDRCGSPMVIKEGRYGKFIACSNYPECKNTKPFTTGVKCPLDGGELIERKTKKGKTFWSCSNFPRCKFATWYRPIGQNCPECKVGIILEKKSKDGKSVIFCSNKSCGYKRIIEPTEEEAVKI